MIINHNMNAMNAHRNMGINNNAAGKSMEKLSSGLRINRAGDDAAGLAISEKMRGQIRGLDQASRNAEDGISMIQTAEGALNETHNILQRMRELAVQAANDTNTADDRTQIQKEINQLTEEVDRIANNTEFNTQKLLNGNKQGVAGQEISAAVVAVTGKFTAAATIAQGNTIEIDGTKVTLKGTAAASWKAQIQDALGGKYAVSISAKGIELTQTAGNETDKTGMSIKINNKAVEVTTKDGVAKKDAVISEGSISLQVGANEDQNMTLEIKDMRADALGIVKAGNVNAGERGLSVANAEDANAAITAFDDALNTVSTERAKLGAVQNRLEYTTSNLDNTSENLQAAESRVRDVDMAKEMMTFSKNNILQQAAQSMLAQANQQPQGVLSLLQ